MQSFILISKDKEEAKNYLLNFAKEQNISNFDIFTLETEKTLGISDVKSLSSHIFLKPLKGDKKIIAVEAFFGATVDAQNAFLKILEEPPLSTYIFILASENYFLLTVLSRVKLVKLDRGVTLTKEDEKIYSEILENLRMDGVGYRLKLAQDISNDKEEALGFIEKLIVFAREKMLEGNGVGEYKKIIETTQKYYKEIKQSNVNLRLALENLFLQI